MRWLPAIIGATLLAGCGGDPSQRVDGVDGDSEAERTFSAAHTVEELVSDGHPTAQGSLLCADGAGWTVYGWRVPMNNRRDPRGLPVGAPEVSALVGEDGAYLLALPSGPRRFIAAIQDGSGRIAWSDPHARTFPMRTSLEGIALDCDLRPTAATDGSTVVSQGVVLGSARHDRESALNQTPLELTAVGSTPVRNNERAMDNVKIGSEAHARILRKRYENDLSEEELDVMMPMLKQLSDDPGAADRLVGRFKRIGHHGKGKLPDPHVRPSQQIFEHRHTHRRGGH